MKEEVLKQIETLKFGDLVIVDWYDHTKRELRLGKKRRGKMVLDLPVTSFGCFIAIAGEEIQHLIILRDVFRWVQQGDFDVDIASVMVPAIKCIRVVGKAVIDPAYSEDLAAAVKQGTLRVIRVGKRVKLRRRLNA
jgi:hypothetical protein